MEFKFEEKDVVFFWNNMLEIQSGMITEQGEAAEVTGAVYGITSQEIEIALEEHKLFATEREAKAAGWSYVRKMRKCFEAARTIIPGEDKRMEHVDAVVRLTVALFNAE